jgi:putative two-component system response regulator
MIEFNPIPELSPPQRQTILVIDDDPAAISLIDGGLKHEYHIRVALDGEKGVQLTYSKEVPDLILLDVLMPKMDGYAVCEAIRRYPPTRHVPILFLTSLADEFSTLRAFELGANDFIAKPICPRVLGVRVQAHLALSNHQRDLEHKVRERTHEIEGLQLNIIQCLSRAAEFRDNETGMHVIRMSHYARALALSAGVGEAAARMLLNAAPMHDVGKIGIPDHILLKPGRLDEAEFELIRQHPLIGAEILGRHGSELMCMARTVALAHHEKWDGSGYPFGLRAEEIPFEGRIVAVADVFDALTTARPYKNAWPVEEALAYLQAERGKHFEPRLIDHFVEILPEILAIKEEYAE